MSENTTTTDTAADAKVRKTPATSGKAKLKWEGDVAKAEGVEVGRRVQKDGKWNAVVKVGGKNETLATGVSHNRAYAVVVAFYHRGERPVVKAAKKAAPVKKSA